MRLIGPVLMDSHPLCRRPFIPLDHGASSCKRFAEHSINGKRGIKYLTSNGKTRTSI